MKTLAEELINGFIETRQIIDAIDAELAPIPDGWIVPRNNKKYYRHRVNGIPVYDTVPDIDALDCLFRRRKLLLANRREYQNKLNEYKAALQRLHINIDEILADYNVLVIERKEREALKQREYEKAQKKPHSEIYIHETAKGDFVASKAEMMIADSLFRYNIRYMYETEIITSEGIHVPDFKIFIPRKIYYWEHLGLMDNPVYRDRWYKKKARFEELGIYENQNLIVTQETREYPLTQTTIDRVIQTYLL